MAAYLEHLETIAKKEVPLRLENIVGAEHSEYKAVINLLSSSQGYTISLDVYDGHHFAQGYGVPVPRQGYDLGYYSRVLEPSDKSIFRKKRVLGAFDKGKDRRALRAARREYQRVLKSIERGEYKITLSGKPGTAEFYYGNYFPIL